MLDSEARMVNVNHIGYPAARSPDTDSMAGLLQLPPRRPESDFSIRCPAAGQWGIVRTILFALALFAVIPLFVPFSPTALAANGEAAVLQGRYEACLAQQRRLESDPERARLEARTNEARQDLQRAVHDEIEIKDELERLGPSITLMDESLESDRLIERRELMRARLREAERRVKQASGAAEAAEAGLGMHMTSHALAARDLPAVIAQCENLRLRLEAARIAERSDIAASSGGDNWGLEQGQTWSGPSDQVPAEFRQDQRAESGGNQPSKPPSGGGVTTRRDDLPRDLPPFSMPNRTVLDAGAGPYHEFAALCRIGWGSSLARYSVGPADDSIVEHLRFAGDHMRAANATTFDPLRAWPDWSRRQRRLGDLADRLVSKRGAFRASLAVELDMGWSGHAEELAKQMVASQRQHLPTCDSHYARLGYQLCHGQQTWQIAAVAEQEGEHDLTRRAEVEGRRHLQAALGELRDLPKVRLASGRCVDLSPVAESLRTALAERDWSRKVEGANAAFEESLRLLLAASGNRPPIRAVIPGFNATPWTWGANLHPEVRITADEALTITRIKQCKSDWSPNPNRCQAEIRSREMDGRRTEFCCTGDWLTSKVNVPGRGTVVITWPNGPHNRIPIPAGTTVSLGTLYILAGTQGDFDNDAVFALIQGLDASGRQVEIESPIFRASDNYPSYLDMCRKVGSRPN